MSMPEMIDDYTPVNYGAGRGGRSPLGIVLHITDSSPSGINPDGGAVGWFHNPASRVSAHYVVRIDGAIARVVREEDWAWANGVVAGPDLGNPLVRRWVEGGINPNLETISIEIAGRPGAALPAAQWAAAVWLVGDICTRRRIPRDRDHVIGHYQIDSVNRARCPSLTERQWRELIMGEQPATPSYAVGAGIRAAMARAGDEPRGDERYLKDDRGDVLSVAEGRDGLYFYGFGTDSVYRVQRS